jgi:hypothetical protein
LVSFVISATHVRRCGFCDRGLVGLAWVTGEAGVLEVGLMGLGPKVL